jgi:tryptophan-rich sensory protein
MISNVIGIYLPIGAIMLTGLLSSSADYQRQNIGSTKAVAAIGIFSVLQLVNLVYVVIFFFQNLEDSQIQTLPNAALTSILAVIVTFAFPEQKKDETVTSDGR